MSDNIVDLAEERERRFENARQQLAHAELMERHQKMRPFGGPHWVVGRWICPREKWLTDKKEVALQWGKN